MAGEGKAERGPGEAGTVEAGRIGADAVEDMEVAPERGEVAGAKAPLEGVGKGNQSFAGLTGAGTCGERGGCLADDTAAGTVFKADKGVAIPDEADADFVAAERVVGRGVGGIHWHIGGSDGMTGEGDEAVVVEGAHGANISRAARTPSTSAATSSNVL